MRFGHHTNEWITISDMMAGLMMIFLLITVSYMFVTQENKAELEKKNMELEKLTEKMKSVAQNYQDLQLELHNELIREFGKDLARWNAVIDQNDTTIRFKEPEVLFDAGKSTVKDQFKRVLDDFFPRYVRILSSPRFKEHIEEIRIEGHTSDEWQSSQTFDERYLQNVLLSQNRAYETLKYCFTINNITIALNKDWLVSVLRANGLSYAKPLEDREKSRRVEFRAVAKADKGLAKILSLSKEMDKN